MWCELNFFSAFVLTSHSLVEAQLKVAALTEWMITIGEEDNWWKLNLKIGGSSRLQVCKNLVLNASTRGTLPGTVIPGNLNFEFTH